MITLSFEINEGNAEHLNLAIAFLQALKSEKEGIKLEAVKSEDVKPEAVKTKRAPRKEAPKEAPAEDVQDEEAPAEEVQDEEAPAEEVQEVEVAEDDSADLTEVIKEKVTPLLRGKHRETIAKKVKSYGARNILMIPLASQEDFLNFLESLS